MSLAGAWRILRPGNAAIAAVGVLVGAYLEGGLPALADGGSRVGIAAAVAFAFAGAGNARNDLLDVGIDRTAHPGRPLVTGALSPRAAARIVEAGYAIALLGAVLLGWVAFALVAASLLAMEAYERSLKARGLPGNAVVAALSAVPFLFGGLVAGGPGLIVQALAALAFLASLGREILKDVEDARADAGARRTLVARWGEARANRLAGLALALAVVLSPVPFVLARLGPAESALGWSYVPGVLLADAAFLAAAGAGWSPGRRQRLVKVGMVLALLALVAARWHAEAIG